MAEAISGTLDGGVHRLPLRVYHEDTDAGGVVYHANYLRFAERARTEMMRLIGVDHSGLRDKTGTVFVVRRLEVEYFGPAGLDDEIEVETRLLALGAATAELEQVIRRGTTDLVHILLKLAFVAPAGRPVRLPAIVRAALQPVVRPQPGS
ncbi:MAG: YbgC/FadM family acyl-CoA thioesterase [Alphaproteobacteria bacterium]